MPRSLAAADSSHRSAGGLRGDARLLSCPDRATDRDPPARGTQRLPARAGGEARDRRRSSGGPGTGNATRVATPSSTSAGPCRRATGPTASRPWSAGSAACARTTARGAAASVVHRSSDPGHWIVTFPWVRRGARPDARPRRRWRSPSRDVSPSRTARLTGNQERLLARWSERIAEARTSPPAWIRDADRRVPVVSISGTNGKSTVTRLITHILHGRRVATSGRRPRTACSSTSA